MKLPHPKYRPDIDGLRAIAILSVVAYHAFPNAVRGGFIGVDIFFVISGYLISTIIFGSLERNSFSFVEFYSRRIKRIFPALLLVLITCFAFGWFALWADEYAQLGKHIAGGAGFVSNFLFWYESGYFDTAAETKPLLHLWTLGIEEQFYIVWPLLLWLAWKLRLNLLSITLVVAVISFALNLTKVGGDAAAAFYSPQTRFWELLAGSILAYITLHSSTLLRLKLFGSCLRQTSYAQMLGGRGQRTEDKILHNFQSLFGAVLIAIGIFVITKDRSFPGWWALFPTLGAVLLISAGKEAWLNRNVLSSRILVWFGLISFPLYLWHWPLLSFARIVESETPLPEVRVAVVMISIVLAWMTYLLIERPIRFGNHSKAKTITLLVLMAVVGYAGYICFKRDGFIFRFPKEVALLVSPVDFKFSSYIRDDICHLHNLSLEKHDSSCSEKKRPLFFLWGDSAAAAIYPGLKKLQGQYNFGITQLTAAACPPLLDLTNENLIQRKNCNTVNKLVFDRLKKERPEVVLLHSVWNFPPAYNISNDELDQKLTATILQIKNELPTSSIILIGPLPQWKATPQNDAFKNLRNKIILKEPNVMQKAIRFDDLDSLFKKTSLNFGVTYISALKYLCTDEGCISRIGDEQLNWIGVDRIHLSKAGSEFFIEIIQDELFSEFKSHFVLIPRH